MKILTETGSTHVIDFDEMTYQRITTGQENVMRKDGEPVSFYGFVDVPEIGKTVSLIIRVADDDLPGYLKLTCRTTAVITEIQEE